MAVLAHAHITPSRIVVVAVLFAACDWDAQNNDRIDASLFEAFGFAYMDDRFWNSTPSDGSCDRIDCTNTIHTPLDLAWYVDGDFIRSDHWVGAKSSVGGAF